MLEDDATAATIGRHDPIHSSVVLLPCSFAQSQRARSRVGIVNVAVKVKVWSQGRGQRQPSHT
jgi:hypothetical protein